jgi:hypothetical protein
MSIFYSWKRNAQESNALIDPVALKILEKREKQKKQRRDWLTPIPFPEEEKIILEKERQKFLNMYEDFVEKNGGYDEILKDISKSSEVDKIYKIFDRIARAKDSY